MRAVRTIAAFTLVCAVVIIGAVAPRAQTPTTDEEFDKLMKGVGQTVGSLRKNMEGQMTDAAVADARKMVDLQKSNAVFWTARKAQDATEWANAAVNHATMIEKALTAKDAAGAAEHTKMLMGACGSCHMKYRDKGADGTYIMKKMPTP